MITKIKHLFSKKFTSKFIQFYNNKQILPKLDKLEE